jgi:hypothetical protein
MLLNLYFKLHQVNNSMATHTFTCNPVMTLQLFPVTLQLFILAPPPSASSDVCNKKGNREERDHQLLKHSINNYK